MPGKWRFLLSSFFSLIVLTATFVVSACPYCPPTDATLSEKLAESDAACLVRFLSSKNGEELSMQTTTFQIMELMKPSLTYRIEGVIETPYGVTANNGDLFLLMGQKKDDAMEWSLPVEIDEVSREYVRQAPSPEGSSQKERLAYFLKFLDVSNPVMSNDAFSEFARSKFEDVEQLRPRLSRVKIRKWLEDPNPQLIVRRAFYGMLLGLCGNNDDAQYLKQTILAPIKPDQNRIGIEGMMGGYLLLSGEEGLQTLIEQKIDAVPIDATSSDSRLVDLNGLRMTLSFLWDFRRSQFREESLRAAMRRYLDRPEFAELAVVDLARWKDWKPLDQLIAAYGHEPWETKSAKEKIVAYALSCRKDATSATVSEFPASAIKAQQFLDSLDPEFVQSVKRSSGGLTPAIK